MRNLTPSLLLCSALSLVIAGCAPDKSPPEVITPWGDYGPNDALVQAARDNYEGSSKAAILNSLNAPVYLDTLAFGPIAVREFDASRDGFDFRKRTSILELLNARGANEMSPYSTYVNLELTRGCSQGGSVTESLQNPAENSQDAYLKILDYDACRSDGFELDGRLTISQRQRAPDYGYPTHAGYDRLRITFNSRTLEFIGAETWPARSDCGNQLNSRLTTLLVRDASTNEAILLDDIRTQGIIGDSACTSYERRYTGWVSAEGAMVHSAYGRVEISSPRPQRYVNDPRDPSGQLRNVSETTEPFSTFDSSEEAAAETEPDGQLRFDGADDSHATFSYLWPYREVQLLSPQPPYAEFKVVGSEGEDATQFYRVAASSFVAGSLTDLRDDDEDGMPNGWEQAHGLDSTNALDVSSDADSDRMSALQEYLWISDPNVTAFSDRGTSTIDDSIEVTMYHAVDLSTGEQTLRVNVMTQQIENAPNRTTGEFSLHLTGNASWDQERVPENCSIESLAGSSDEQATTAPNRVVGCSIDYADQRLRSHFESEPLFIIGHGDGDIEVKAQLQSPLIERNPDNNIASAIHAYVFDLPVDFDLHVDEFALGNSDDIGTVEATIEQVLVAGPANLEARVQIPAGLVIEAAQLSSSRDSVLVTPPARCILGAEIVCSLEGIQHGDKLTLALQHLVVQTGSHAIQWDISTNATANTPENDARTTHVESVDSVAALQDLVDLAEDGDTVELPEGRFLGTLNLSHKEISLVGANSGNGTELISTDRTQPLFKDGGVRVTLSNFTLRTTGGPLVQSFNINLTISDSVITPVEKMPHFMDGLLPQQNYHTRLWRNRITGWGHGDENTCRRLIGAALDNTYVRIDRNEFVSNHCEAIVLFDNENQYGRYHIYNNVFFDNPAFLSATGQMASKTVEVINNIIVGSDSLLNLSEQAWGQSGRNARGYLSSARNIIQDSESSSLLSIEMLDRPGITLDQPDLDADPGFVDAENNDFRLRVASEAIDQGADVEPYRWDPPLNEGLVETLQPPANSNVSAIDGDGDGEARLDIGAFEYSGG